MAFATPLFREYGYADEDEVEYRIRKIRHLVPRQRKISESAPDLQQANDSDRSNSKIEKPQNGEAKSKLIKQTSIEVDEKKPRANSIVGLIRRISSKELVPRRMSVSTAKDAKGCS